MLPVIHKLMTCVISLSFKRKLLVVKYCSFKIINTTISSVMKHLLAFQPVEVKQNQHFVNHTNFFFLVLRISVCHRPDLWQLLQ